MDVRPSGSAIETKESHCWKALLPMEVTPSGTTTCPSASGVYKQRAATPPSASRAKINIASIGPSVRAWVVTTNPNQALRGETPEPEISPPKIDNKRGVFIIAAHRAFVSGCEGSRHRGIA